MKTVTKRIETPEPREVERVTKITCDICKAHSIEGDDLSSGAGTNWETKHSYDFDAVKVCKTETTKITLRHRKGASFPEGSFYVEQFFDVCPACWKRLVDILATNYGAKPQAREGGY